MWEKSTVILFCFSIIMTGVLHQDSKSSTLLSGISAPLDHCQETPKLVFRKEFFFCWQTLGQLQGINTFVSRRYWREAAKFKYAVIKLQKTHPPFLETVPRKVSAAFGFSFSVAGQHHMCPKNSVLLLDHRNIAEYTDRQGLYTSQCLFSLSCCLLANI